MQMRKLLLSLLLVGSMLNGYSQENLIKAPKVKSLELGYYNIASSTFSNISNHGITALFDYSWQLSGFNNSRAAAYISVPLGYTYFHNFSNDSTKNSTRILAYGWTVKHDLAKDKKVVPFLGYGLLLNQLSFKDVVGRTFGHQTRFDFGLDFHNCSMVHYLKVEYSFTRYPQFGKSKSEIVHAASIKYGFRF